MRKTINIESRKRIEYVDITSRVQAVVAETRLGDGVVFLYTPHTTTALTLNENESGLISDMQKILEHLVPEGSYQHDKIDNNADAHLRSLILGQHLMILFTQGRLELGRWQSIFFVELDGPRNRKIIFKALRG